jgi:hypothetical protein
MLLSLNLIFTILIASVLEGFSPDRPASDPGYNGEYMHYRLKYGIFNIGVATISCLEDRMECGCVIKAEAQSTGLLRIFKNLNYRFECCMDPATGLPNSAIMNLQDGNNTAFNEVLYDHVSMADSVIIISQAMEVKKYIVQKDIYDILTGFYHFRSHFINESTSSGLPVVIQIFIADMLWDLRIKYTGAETIGTMYGQLSCRRFTSSTVVGRFFRNDDDMTVWFTNDEIPVPVKIHLNLKLGAITGELEGYEKPVSHSTQLKSGK